MTKSRRYRVLADVRLQGILCYRVALYWVCCLLSVALFLGWGAAFDGGYFSARQWLSQLWQHQGAAVILPLLVLPMVMLDCLIYSNKIAGPVMRLRKSMRALADGEDVEALRFRPGDYFTDAAEDCNRIAARLQEHDAKEPASMMPASHDYAKA